MNVLETHVCRRPMSWVVVLVGIAGAMAFGLAESANGASACPNEAFRGGASAALPDCRAYEQVTPPDAGDRKLLTLVTAPTYNLFPTDLATADGTNFLTSTNGTPFQMPSEPSGTYDLYEAVRGTTGWEFARLLTPNGQQASFAEVGGVSADHRYTVFSTNQLIRSDEFTGELGEEGVVDYLSKPGRTFELLATGSLGSELRSQVHFISGDGEHVIFSTGNLEACWSAEGCDVTQLEPDAPPTGTGAVYDRSATGGETHVVSLLPGDVTPRAGENAEFQGVSTDGSAVAFSLLPSGGSEPALYVRIDNRVTKPVTTGAFTFAGIRGGFLFYVAAGNVFRYDIDSGATTQVTLTADAELVNIAADGQTVYYLSATPLPGSGAAAGQPNLYSWSGTTQQSTFVATVAPADLEGQPALNRWTESVSPFKSQGQGPGGESSRVSADGSVLVFESRAKLAGYPNEGHTEIYVYDGSADTILCASCNPSGEPATSDARLESLEQLGGAGSGGETMIVNNLSSDGHRVFFETSERLLSRDVDGVNDIYEWSDADPLASSSLSLISAGTSTATSGPFGLSEPNVIFAISPSGNDIFFRTTDALVGGSESGGNYSIYDARVDGGFPDAAVDVCLKGRCESEATGSSPPRSAAASQVFRGRGNVRPHKAPGRCKHATNRRGRKPSTRQCAAKRHHRKHRAKKSEKGSR
jgi:hypothetical protein